ncbi:MAG: hypothetical protein EBZ17_07155 [Actinobacteria bacterium]|nr:hypothetical protein [Actinomycetota bacterium]
MIVSIVVSLAGSGMVDDMAVCAFVSFRLGLTDGVSVVTGHWQRAVESMGFDTVTVAGEGPVDRTVAGLELAATNPPDLAELRAALADADLIVVENLCTIPLNLPAAQAVGEICAGRPTVMHHHDPPWQRAHFAHITELPIQDPAWRHVTINDLTRDQFRDRGIDAIRIYNGFPTETRPGTSPELRAMLDIAPDEVVLAHPVRAIERKDVPRAIAIAEELDATYWLWGPAEDGYGDELSRILSSPRPGRASATPRSRRPCTTFPPPSARTPSPTNSADWASTGSRPTTPAHSADSLPTPTLRSSPTIGMSPAHIFRSSR